MGSVQRGLGRHLRLLLISLEMTSSGVFGVLGQRLLRAYRRAGGPVFWSAGVFGTGSFAGEAATAGRLSVWWTCG